MNIPDAEIKAALTADIPQSLVPSGDGSIVVHRLDQLFPVASGNKIYKLLAHLQAARRANKSQLLSFGGAWSNHLHALAVFAQQVQLQSTAIVRGLYVDIDNPMLSDARARGMTVELVSKQHYAQRRNPAYLAELKARFPDAWLIPEGGDDAYGRWGLRYLASTLMRQMPRGETLVLASGTGATVRGLALSMQAHAKIVSALVVDDAPLARRLEHLCRMSSQDFRLFDCSGAGYGRVDAALLQSLEQFYQQSGVLLDPLYNGKALALAQRLAQQGERVHLLHTGGVQGWRGFLQRGLLAPYPTLSKQAAELAYRN